MADDPEVAGLPRIFPRGAAEWGKVEEIFKEFVESVAGRTSTTNTGNNNGTENGASLEQFSVQSQRVGVSAQVSCVGSAPCDDAARGTALLGRSRHGSGGPSAPSPTTVATCFSPAASPARPVSVVTATALRTDGSLRRLAQDVERATTGGADGAAAPPGGTRSPVRRSLIGLPSHNESGDATEEDGGDLNNDDNDGASSRDGRHVFPYDPATGTFVFPPVAASLALLGDEDGEGGPMVGDGGVDAVSVPPRRWSLVDVLLHDFLQKKVQCHAPDPFRHC